MVTKYRVDFNLHGFITTQIDVEDGVDVAHAATASVMSEFGFTDPSILSVVGVTALGPATPPLEEAPVEEKN